MSYIKDDKHLGNSQWRIDKTVTEECVMSDRAVIKTLHTNIVHTSTLACGYMYWASIFLHKDILFVGICKLEEIVKVK